MYKFPLVGLLFSVPLLNVSPAKTRDFSQNDSRNESRIVFRDESADTARADATITNATVYFGYGAELNHESKV
ncbi:MAG: hypothetical protein ABIR18_13305, partial [Chitinophagaceae bacterium]